MSPLPDLEKVNWGTVGYHARSAFAVILSLAVLIGGGWFVYDRVNQAYMEWRTEDDYVGEGGEEVEVVIPGGRTSPRPATSSRRKGSCVPPRPSATLRNEAGDPKN